jgi:hypothetical protein
MSTRQAVRSLRQMAGGRSFSTVVDDRMAMAANPLPKTGRVLQEAMRQTAPRHNWSKDEIREIYKTPLMELAHQSVLYTFCAGMRNHALLTRSLSGCNPPPFPLSVLDSDVHAHEHQDWRVLRGLLVLCPVVSLRYWYVDMAEHC